MLDKSPKLLEHRLDLDVQIFDTDCYGVMWHGSYLKWMEMGRVKLLEQNGVKLSKPGDPEGYIYPVVEQTLKFRTPANYQDHLTLLTSLEIAPPKLIFHQSFYNHTTGKIAMEASTHNLILDAQWKVLRRLPAEILNKLQS